MTQLNRTERRAPEATIVATVAVRPEPTTEDT